MFVGRCARCSVKGDKVMLFDVIYEGRAEVLCERCSIIENISIIKKPEESQIKEADRGFGVYERMKRIAGMPEPVKEDSFFREERLKELDENPELEAPVRKFPELIDYFHLGIMRNRRRRGFTQEKLAMMLGVSKRDIELLEKGEVNEDSEIIIEKIEDFFNIRLRKRSPFKEEKEAKPFLLDEYGRRLENIPEPEIEIIEEEFEKEEIKKPRKIVVDKIVDEEGYFDVHRADLEEVRISDLKELHKKRIEASKEERKLEQKRIEERQKIIEARKEELRMMKEKDKKEIDNILGGSELLNLDRDKYEEKENKVDKLFDDALKDD